MKRAENSKIHSFNGNRKQTLITIAAQRKEKKASTFTEILKIPSFLACLPKSELLTCRQLNRNSKLIIDAALCRASNCDQSISKMHPKIIETSVQIRNRYKFDKEDICESFMQVMGHYETTSQNNPFILGNVEVDLVGTSRFSYFCDKLTNMFKMYGYFVMSLTLRFGRGLAQQVGVLIEILNCVPNLIQLRVETHPCFFISWPFHYEEIYARIQNIRLTHLKSMDVSQCTTVIGMNDSEYWDDWCLWKNKPRSIEGALYEQFRKQFNSSINK